MFSAFLNRQNAIFVLRLCHQRQRISSSVYSSSWCGPKSPASHMSDRDLEQLFFDRRVQQLLTRMTGKDEPKMTDMYRKYLDRLEQRSDALPKFVPFKEPIAGGETLSKDPECDEGMRQPADRKLRTEFTEQRGDEKHDESTKEPAIFSINGQSLQAALDKDEHKFVLDWAVHFYEPDDPKFVEFCKHIFDKTLEANKLDVLHSTRHFGTLAFYLLINGKLPALLKFYAQRKSVDGVANTIRLWRMLFPSWKPTVDIDRVNLKVVKDFVFSVAVAKRRPDRAESLTTEDIGRETVRALLGLVSSSGEWKSFDKPSPIPAWRDRYGYHGPFTVMDVDPPEKYDVALDDINEMAYKELEAQTGIRNLSPAEFRSPAFPATGWIFGTNDRLMVCLPCRRNVAPTANVPPGAIVNVWFTVVTGSRYNFLAMNTVKALVHDGAPKPALCVSMGDPNSSIECSVSPADKHFPEANILGYKALYALSLSIDIDWTNKQFKLITN